MIGIFVNEAGMTVEKLVAFSLIRLLIAVAYAAILTKTLPKKPDVKANADEK